MCAKSASLSMDYIYLYIVILERDNAEEEKKGRAKERARERRREVRTRKITPRGPDRSIRQGSAAFCSRPSFSVSLCACLRLPLFSSCTIFQRSRSPVLSDLTTAGLWIHGDAVVEHLGEVLRFASSACTSSLSFPVFLVLFPLNLPDFP